ncbi:hypothetical protein BRC83_08445 [Halobacteriales archaeon QS_1_68_17]|nr:MAG: hypothetical protein BRC83_08445 [Halobacteriales archaeon QS_1_68_17]
MPFKATGNASEFEEIDRWEGGFGWIAHPEEDMRRASHALLDAGDVWVVDPVDAAGLDGLLAEEGEVAGVVVLLDRHKRDAAEVARRHDVSVHVPSWMNGVADALDAPVEYLHAELGDTGYELHRLVDNAFWQEAALYHGGDGTLVVPESLGTAPFFLAGEERLGVHPVLRISPPGVLRQFAPERILVGHGHGVRDRTTEALRDALDGSRRRMPGLYAQTLRRLVMG